MITATPRETSRTQAKRVSSRQRILTTCAYRQPDKLPVDFGGGFQTGIHVSMVYKLRQALDLDQPDTPVKVVEVYQMPGEIAPDLREALGVDTVSLCGRGTIFGFPQTDLKEWQLADGTPVLVPRDFNTQYKHLPVAAPMTVVRSNGAPLTIPIADVATNWSDPDGDPRGFDCGRRQHERCGSDHQRHVPPLLQPQ